MTPNEARLTMTEAVTDRSILYITHDGLTTPLGYSQVVRLLLRMSARGYRYTVISMEQAPEPAEVARVQELLEEHGITWEWIDYESGARGAFNNITRVMQLARRAHRREAFDLVHARGYIPAAVSRCLNLLYGLHYVFDKRGFWVDEKLDSGSWFTNPAAYAVAKRVERDLFESSSAVVSLSAVGARDLQGGVFGDAASRIPTHVIPTCVDYNDFSHALPIELDADLAARMHDKIVVGFVGSINASYFVDETMQLFAHLHRLSELEGVQKQVFFLCLTRQVDALSELFRAHGIPERSWEVRSARHEQMPGWLKHMNWGMVLVKETFAKRGSMPTKLGEFFASGVRPVQFGCNDDVSHWVHTAGSGVILDGLSPDDLESAAREILSQSKGLTHHELVTEGARVATKAHFSLETAVVRYDEIMRTLIHG